MLICSCICCTRSSIEQMDEVAGNGEGDECGMIDGIALVLVIERTIFA